MANLGALQPTACSRIDGDAFPRGLGYIRTLIIVAGSYPVALTIIIRYNRFTISSSRTSYDRPTAFFEQLRSLLSPLQTTYVAEAEESIDLKPSGAGRAFWQFDYQSQELLALRVRAVTAQSLH